MTKALFLDRDGTINIDHVYINDPKKIELIPDAALALRKAQEAGFLLIVISNQSGIGRGIIDPKVLPLIHEELDRQLLKAEGVKIDHYFFCPHIPEEKCDCRKPSPKLVFKARDQFSIDLSESYFLGDRLSDVGAGLKAGCKGSILLRTGKGQGEEALIHKPQNTTKPSLVADDLLQAVEWILR
ncbi:MAG: HAD family hydrolase [Oligoflexia bacterium]|nr:HAD family hydrolase [Oligoflexia bacterium]